MRFFKNRQQVDKVCLMKGELPAGTGEIAIDRMYADNNNLSVGDTLRSGKRTWKITGLVALSDYSCLFQNNNDSMFDAVKFGVSVVTEEEFDSLDQEKLQYNYSWIYDEKPKTEKEEKRSFRGSDGGYGKDCHTGGFCTPVSESGHYFYRG
mgnify:FL=1